MVRGLLLSLRRSKVDAGIGGSVKTKSIFTQEQFEANLLKKPLNEVLKYLDQLEVADELILESIKADGTPEQIEAAEKEIALRKKERFEFMTLRMLSAGAKINKRKRMDAG
jgi:hypothetical protein